MFLNLGPVRGLPALLDNDRFAWKVTPIVRDEVKHPESRSILERAILDGTIDLVEIDTSLETEGALLARLSQKLDAGEAESLALAIARSWQIALEDRKGQRIAVEEGAHWINSADVLLDAIDDDRLSEDQADALFSRLSCYPGYRKRGINRLSDLGRKRSR
jgi:predicted nucleic acid-binding protein